MIERAFTMYLSRITPPRTQLEAAQRSHNALRDFLAGDPYFGSMIVTTFLNGSYARRTVIRPIKDVDIVVVVGKDWLEDSPAKAMEALRRKLAQRYPERRTARQRRAVRVELHDMQLDVVLAVASGDERASLRIPDRRADRWLETHPKKQLDLTARLGRATDGNYSRLVRLLKAWSRARVARADRPSSFVLECAAFHMMTARPAEFCGRLDNAFVALLTALRRWDFGRTGWLFRRSQPQVMDPALSHVNVAERWAPSAADSYMGKVDVALARCDGLARSRWEETEVGRWRTIFGTPFPSPATVL